METYVVERLGKNENTSSLAPNHYLYPASGDNSRTPFEVALQTAENEFEQLILVNPSSKSFASEALATAAGNASEVSSSYRHAFESVFRSFDSVDFFSDPGASVKLIGGMLSFGIAESRLNFSVDAANGIKNSFNKLLNSQG